MLPSHAGETRPSFPPEPSRRAKQEDIMALAQLANAGISRLAVLARGYTLTVALLLLLSGSGCSARNLTVNSMADALAASGSGFGADDDVEFIGAAAPFSLKLMESVLAESPGHRGLLLAAAQGF